MLSAILTWIGAMLGIAVLLAMAFGAFVLDYNDARGNRAEKATEVPKGTSPLA
ncbi:hypothetical protein [Qaidamihabitans albus]|uniref:hypothetical protein n=1 Tax=Qaidamihabitans albus TaxID=2795733 RepID=UPI0018F197D4|nr:hypothetical protein [Qaidamihabitans albus]